MPRTAGKIPSYRHHKARNLAVVTLNGKPKYLGRYDSPESHREYDRVVQEWLAAGRQAAAAQVGGATESGAALTISELIGRYWAFARGYYVRDGMPTRELENLKDALRPLRKGYGMTPAESFGPVALKALRRGMIDAGLARNTINFRIGKVKRVFKWAVSEELIPPAVYQGLDAVDGLRVGQFGARETAPVRPVDPKLVAAVLPFVTAPVGAMIRLQDLTGMRPGEVLAMKSGEVDRSGEVWVYRPAHHKTAHKGFTRSILLGPKAQEVLTPWLREDPAAYVFQPAEGIAERNAKRRRSAKDQKRAARPKKRKSEKGRRDGLRYRISSYQSAIHLACGKAFPHPELSQIPRPDRTPEQTEALTAWRREHRWHPNQLRHAAATRIRKAFGLESAQVILGHAKADTTEIHAERDMSKAVEVARALG